MHGSTKLPNTISAFGALHLGPGVTLRHGLRHDISKRGSINTASQEFGIDHLKLGAGGKLCQGEG